MDTGNESPKTRPAAVVTGELREILHRKEAVCTELAGLSGQTGITDYAGRIAALCADYANSGTIPQEYSEVLDKKFSEALEQAKKGAEIFEARRNAIAKLEAETDAVIAAGDLATLNEVLVLEKKLAEAGCSAAIEKLSPLKDRLQAEADDEKAAADAALKLAAELVELTAAEDIAPLHDRKPEIEKEFAALANIPRQAANVYNDAHRKAAVRLAQHYETLDLARWESYTRKLDICSELEKLCAVPADELGKVSKTLNDIRDKWKQLGSVPNEKREEINPRYLELTRTLQHRIDEYFARKRQAQKLAAAEKVKLCESAEALADSTDWGQTSGKMRELQEQWKVLERAGNQESELFARFRAAMDKFFNARKAAYDVRDRETKAAVARKKALIEEALNLTDVRRAKQLREEYRNSGSAGRKEPELYKEFNDAMEKFFSGRRAEVNAKEARARELIAEIEALSAAPADAVARVREIREEFRTLSCRETRSDEQNVLRKFDAALARIREEERARRIAGAGDITAELAQCCDKFFAGETVEAPAPENYAGFAKLQTAATLLTAAVNGDAKAAEKLEKQIAAARIEREKICAALEKLAGKNDADASAPVSLAEELQAAMMGNFGKVSAREEKVSDPKQLLADYANCGIVPAAELSGFQARIDAAVKIIG